MTAVVPYSERPDRLAAWAEEARLTHQIAISLAGTSFVPKMMQGRPDEVTGAILAGRELGLEPMAALRAIDIIDGTPAIRAVALRGILQAQGHKIWVEESTATRAVVCAQRRGEQTVQRSVWTMDRAKTAGLAGKRNWMNNPQSMLIARATGEVARLIAADAIVGLAYVAEEIQDGIEEAAPAEKKTTKARSKPAAEPKAVPDLPPPPTAGTTTAPNAVTTWNRLGTTDDGGRVFIAPADPAPAAEEAMTPARRAALMASFRAAGVNTAEQRHDLCTRIAGREIENSTQLTADEARAVMAELHAVIDAKERAGGAVSEPLIDPDEPEEGEDQ